MTTPPAALSDAEVAAFRELASKVTPSGKWYMDFDEHCLLVICGGSIVAEVPFTEERKESQADIDRAEFIAAARNLADRLVAEVQEKRVVVRQLMDALSVRDAQLAAANARIAEQDGLIATLDESLVGTGRTALLSMNDLIKARYERDALAKRLAEAERREVLAENRISEMHDHDED